MEYYFDWDRFSDVARLLFARRKPIRAANSYWISVERYYLRRRVVIESCKEIKEKFKKKYLPEYNSNRLLNQLHNLRKSDMPVQDYITKIT